MLRQMSQVGWCHVTEFRLSRKAGAQRRPPKKSVDDQTAAGPGRGRRSARRPSSFKKAQAFGSKFGACACYGSYAWHPAERALGRPGRH